MSFQKKRELERIIDEISQRYFKSDKKEKLEKLKKEYYELQQTTI